MVNRKFFTQYILITLLVFTVATINSIVVEAADTEYYLSHEWSKIWINQDGTIDLLYDIEIACTQGTITYMEVGQPNSDFKIGEARDENEHTLTASDVSSGDYYAVRVRLHSQISAGESARFTLLTNVGHMIWEDEYNVGNVGMQFIPTWWEYAQVNDLKVAVVMPQGVTTQKVKCTPNWNNAYHDPDEDNRLVVYWERKNLRPNEKLSLGVSFPKEFVEYYETREEGLDWKIIGLILTGSVLAAGSVFAVLKFRKQGYVTPVLRMETLGTRRGLTAVEASHLLGLPPTKIVAEILYSLLMKKAVWVEATDPVLKIEVMRPFEVDTETVENPLRYYEIGFLEAVKKDRTLDETRLAKTLMLLRDTVEAKLHGYCRQDTISYYKNIVAKAWKQVEQAGAPELASKAYDENLLWLLLDENVQSETSRIFKDWDFTPEPDWWWYWYIYTHYPPRTGTGPPTTDRTPPTVPGADFANDIVTSIEKTANNIVVNVEKFANSILPPSPPKHTSRQPARRGASCVCACAACACACACVSCACACASGGVG